MPADPGELVADGLGVGPGDCVAVVGAGGKTTLVLALRRTLAGRGLRVAVTTTTRMAAAEVAGVAGFVGEPVPGGKVRGPGVAAVDALADGGTVDVVLVEADGARDRLVKAPGAHEPVIPPTATLVIAVMAAPAVGRVILDAAHRPLRVAALAGCPPGRRLTAEGAARVLLSERGGRKGVPAGARYAVALTRVGPAEREAAEAVRGLVEAAGVAVVTVPEIVTVPEVPPAG